jgi:6-phosphogluconolactonase (cycloisomerase 2 family)
MNARVLRVLGLLALLSGCGGGGSSGPPATPAKFMYATASQGPNSFEAYTYGFAVYTNGALAALSGFSPVYAGDYGGLPVVITHDSKLLYAPNNDETANFAAFNINADGSLSSAATPSFQSPLQLAGVTAHPSADLLYESSTGGILAVLAVDAQSAALEQTSSVTLGNSDDVDVTNGPLITADGHFLYQTYYNYPGGVGQGNAQALIAGFSIDAASGALTVVPGSPVTPGIPAGSGMFLAVDPAGKFLYVGYPYYDGVVEKGGVIVFSIDASSGALSAVPAGTVGLGGPPNGVSIDASGKFLLIAEQGSAACSVEVLSVDAGSGALAAVPGSPFSPSTSYCGNVVADPTLPFVYVTLGSMSGPGGILTFSINETTGALASVAQTLIADSSIQGVGYMVLTH